MPIPAVPVGAVIVPGPLDPKQVDALKALWDAAFVGPTVGPEEAILLPPGCYFVRFLPREPPR